MAVDHAPAPSPSPAPSPPPALPLPRAHHRARVRQHVLLQLAHDRPVAVPRRPPPLGWILSSLAEWLGVPVCHSNVQVQSVADPRRVVEFGFEGGPQAGRTGVYQCAPGMNPHLALTRQQRCYLGDARLTHTELVAIVDKLERAWTAGSYNFLDRNCNHFCGVQAGRRRWDRTRSSRGSSTEARGSRAGSRAEARALDRQAVVRGELDRRDGVRDGARGADWRWRSGTSRREETFRRDENDAPRRRAEERRGVPPRGPARGAQDARAAAGERGEEGGERGGERGSEKASLYLRLVRGNRNYIYSFIFLHRSLRDAVSLMGHMGRLISPVLVTHVQEPRGEPLHLAHGVRARARVCFSTRASYATHGAEHDGGGFDFLLRIRGLPDPKAPSPPSSPPSNAPNSSSSSSTSSVAVARSASIANGSATRWFGRHPGDASRTTPSVTAPILTRSNVRRRRDLDANPDGGHRPADERHRERRLRRRREVKLTTGVLLRGVRSAVFVFVFVFGGPWFRARRVASSEDFSRRVVFSLSPPGSKTGPGLPCRSSSSSSEEVSA